MDKSFSVMTLPSDYSEMDSFIQKNKVKLMQQIVLSVQHALDNNYPSIEVFTFQRSDFIVILNRSNFKDNIDNIFEYYVATEQYEYCDRLVKLKKQDLKEIILQLTGLNVENINSSIFNI